MADKDNSLLLGEIKGTLQTLMQLIHPKLDDHEKRIRVVEQWKWKLIGAGGALGAIGGFIAALLVRRLGG